MILATAQVHYKSMETYRGIESYMVEVGLRPLAVYEVNEASERLTSPGSSHLDSFCVHGCRRHQARAHVCICNLVELISRCYGTELTQGPMECPSSCRPY